MNIRAITVERGIATLAHQTRLSILLSLSSRDPDNAGAGGGRASAVDDVSSPTGISAQRYEEELEGGYYDDEDNDAWFEERDEGEEIQEEDRSVTRTGITRGNDVEKVMTSNV
jgi:hypothetical protein